jgi:hypothetical protein
MKERLTRGLFQFLPLVGAVLWAAPPAEKAYFKFRFVDSSENVAVFRPLIPPDIGAVVDPASKTDTITDGEYLSCVPKERKVPAIVKDRDGTVSELILDCGDKILVVKKIYFSPRP